MVATISAVTGCRSNTQMGRSSYHNRNRELCFRVLGMSPNGCNNIVSLPLPLDTRRRWQFGAGYTPINISHSAFQVKRLCSIIEQRSHFAPRHPSTSFTRFNSSFLDVQCRALSFLIEVTALKVQTALRFEVASLVIAVLGATSARRVSIG